VLDGNEPSRWELIPDRPGGAEPISAIGVIQHDGGGLRERVLCAEASHCGRAYHDAPPRLKRLCEERSESIEMVDQLTQSTRTLAVGDKGEARQVPQIRLVEFFRKGTAKFKSTLG
jgi:hypothetical protein